MSIKDKDFVKYRTMYTAIRNAVDLYYIILKKTK